MRLFIAINFDEDIKEHFTAIQDRLRQLSHGNFTKRENLHLTLAFLGEIPKERIHIVKKVMSNTSFESFQHIELVFDHVGRFRRNGGDIWWIGIKENKTLLSIHKILSKNLILEGFTLDNRRFSPHITMARQVKLSSPTGTKALLGSPFTTKVNTISLMQSERISGILTYTEIYQENFN